MSISLNLRFLKTRLNSKSSLEEIEGSSHFSDSSVVTGHIVVRHCLSQFIIFTQFFRFLEKVESTVYVFFFKIIDGQNIADFTKLFASPTEFD